MCGADPSEPARRPVAFRYRRTAATRRSERSSGARASLPKVLRMCLCTAPSVTVIRSFGYRTVSQSLGQRPGVDGYADGGSACFGRQQPPPQGERAVPNDDERQENPEQPCQEPQRGMAHQPGQITPVPGPVHEGPQRLDRAGRVIGSRGQQYWRPPPGETVAFPVDDLTHQAQGDGQQEQTHTPSGLVRRATARTARPGTRSNAGSAVSSSPGPWRPGSTNLRFGSMRRFRSRRFISGCEPSVCRRADAPAGKDGPAVVTEEGRVSWHWRGAVRMGLHLP